MAFTAAITDIRHLLRKQWQQVGATSPFAGKIQLSVPCLSRRPKKASEAGAAGKGPRTACKLKRLRRTTCCCATGILREDGRFKMNPPLKPCRPRRSLRASGTARSRSAATDHAPHTAEEKSRGLAGSRRASWGMETTFPLL